MASCTNVIAENTHESNTAGNDQAEGRDTLGGGTVGNVWDGATGGGRGADNTGGSNGASGSDNARVGWDSGAGASVDGDDAGKAVSIWGMRLR